MPLSASWWRSVLACSSKYFHTFSLSCYMHIRSSSWHLSDHGWADVASMDLAFCQCFPIGTFSTYHCLYTLYTYIFILLYTVFRCIPYTFVACVFLVFNSTKVSWDLDICSAACQRDGEISSAAPSRFPQDMSVNQTSRPSSIILGWCGQSVSKENWRCNFRTKMHSWIRSCWCC